MLHGRIVRPRGQGGYGTGAKPLSIDESSIKHIPDAQVVRKGDFVGVVAPKEYDAIQAAAQLKVKWDDTAKLPGSGNLFSAMRAVQTVDALTVNTGNIGNAIGSASKVLSASYTFDYQMHGPIGPPCAVAIVKPDGSGLVMTNTQGVYRLRDQYLAGALGTNNKQIRVQYVEGASAFGHCETDDAACAAAVMSQVLGGTPVRVQFMRWDDNGWDNYGPAQLNDVAWCDRREREDRRDGLHVVGHAGDERAGDRVGADPSRAAHDGHRQCEHEHHERCAVRDREPPGDEQVDAVLEQPCAEDGAAPGSG